MTSKCVYSYGRCRLRSRSRSPRLTAAEAHDLRTNWSREDLESTAMSYDVRGWQRMTNRQLYAALRRRGAIAKPYAVSGAYGATGPIRYSGPYVPSEWYGMTGLYDVPLDATGPIRYTGPYVPSEWYDMTGPTGPTTGPTTGPYYSTGGNIGPYAPIVPRAPPPYGFK
jgi:hypothetical protein